MTELALTLLLAVAISVPLSLAVLAAGYKIGTKLATPAEDTSKHLRRIAVAVEKVVNERTIHQEAKRHAETNENLVMGVSDILSTALTHPAGLKDDVIVGREQADQELKDRLRAELNKALNHTN